MKKKSSKYKRFLQARSLEQIDKILVWLLPHGVADGREWVAPNPTRNDRHAGSFKVNRYKGIWCDFATGDKGDLIGLVAYIKGIDRGDAYEAVAEFLGVKRG